MIDQIIGGILQGLIFMLIPFVVYLIKNKSYRGFWDYIGLKRSNTKANLMALGLAGILATPMLLLIFFNEGFQAIMLAPESVSGQLRLAGLSISTVAMLLFTATFKTAFTEEVLFRGFIAKRLIAWLGIGWGNSLQALIFGLIHWLLFLGITDNYLFLTVILLVTTIGAFGKAYINEKHADGSIVPAWITHATGNLLSYSSVAFWL
ncbi:MAG: CPBP family intramembrane glutamic endopeptidase [Bacteroidota bacterium]